MRIGIDVGGTNTDAVLMNGMDAVGWRKTPTTPDVGSGIITVLRELLASTKVAAADIKAVMIGTTHFTNAIVERKRVIEVAAIRLGPARDPLACLPSRTGQPTLPQPRPAPVHAQGRQ